MPQAKKKRGPPANKRIQLDNPADVRASMKYLGVTRSQLEAAVDAVGPALGKVRAYLKRD